MDVVAVLRSLKWNHLPRWFSCQIGRIISCERPAELDPNLTEWTVLVRIGQVHVRNGLNCADAHLGVHCNGIAAWLTQTQFCVYQILNLPKKLLLLQIRPTAASLLPWGNDAERFPQMQAQMPTVSLVLHTFGGIR